MLKYAQLLEVNTGVLQSPSPVFVHDRVVLEGWIFHRTWRCSSRFNLKNDVPYGHARRGQCHKLGPGMWRDGLVSGSEMQGTASRTYGRTTIDANGAS